MVEELLLAEIAHADVGGSLAQSATHGNKDESCNEQHESALLKFSPAIEGDPMQCLGRRLDKEPQQRQVHQKDEEDSQGYEAATDAGKGLLGGTEIEEDGGVELEVPKGIEGGVDTKYYADEEGGEAIVPRHHFAQRKGIEEEADDDYDKGDDGSIGCRGHIQLQAVESHEGKIQQVEAAAIEHEESLQDNKQDEEQGKIPKQICDSFLHKRLVLRFFPESIIAGKRDAKIHINMHKYA